jgi:hypothetical protein
MSFQLAQRVLSSQFCSTSSSSAQEPRTDRGVLWCVGSSAEQPRLEPRQRSHVRKEWIGVGCPLPRGPQKPVASSNGSGPAVMQGLGSASSKQRSQKGPSLREQPFDCTEFVAETLLPTVSGKYRLRGYRHTVHSRLHVSIGSVRLHLAQEMLGLTLPITRVCLLPRARLPSGGF